MAAANLRFPSAEWCAAYKDAINANPRYKAAGKDWTYGPVAMVVEGRARHRHRGGHGDVLDLHQGSCRDVHASSRGEEAEKAAFVIVASYARWKEVIRKQLDPTKGMMQNG